MLFCLSEYAERHKESNKSEDILHLKTDEIVFSTLILSLGRHKEEQQNVGQFHTVSVLLPWIGTEELSHAFDRSSDLNILRIFGKFQG